MNQFEYGQCHDLWIPDRAAWGLVIDVYKSWPELDPLLRTFIEGDDDILKEDTSIAMGPSDAGIVIARLCVPRIQRTLPSISGRTLPTLHRHCHDCHLPSLMLTLIATLLWIFALNNIVNTAAKWRHILVSSLLWSGWCHYWWQVWEKVRWWWGDIYQRSYCLVFTNDAAAWFLISSWSVSDWGENGRAVSSGKSHFQTWLFWYRWNW